MMAGFLYYIPGPTQGVHLTDAQRMGLGYAFESTSFSPSGVMANGYDEGGQGVMVADPNRVETVGLYPAEQERRKIPGSDVWCVMYRNAKPGPRDLARRDQLDGHWVTLNDGNEWLCPVARGATEEDGGIVWYHAVPRVSRLNNSGDFEPGDVVDRYAPLWATACRWFDVRLAAMTESDGDTVEFSFDGLHKAAIEALAVNYVIGPAECDLLGLLSQETAIEILDALIDMPTRIELLKKIVGPSDGSPTVDGSLDDTPDTDQP